MLKLPKFWPLDFDQESEIYDSPSWNLPGRRKPKGSVRSGRVPVAKKSNS